MFATRAPRPLFSPGFPSKYPMNQECTWIIKVRNSPALARVHLDPHPLVQAQPGQKVATEFNRTLFAIPHFDPCEYDFVEVRNGEDTKAVGKRSHHIPFAPQ